MATDRIALLAEVGKAAAGGDVDFLRTAVKTMAEALMELEVAAKLGADPHERTPERTGYRCRRSPKLPRLDQRNSPADDARIGPMSLLA